MGDVAEVALVRAVDRLVDHCCRWTAAGWRHRAAPAPVGPGSAGPGPAGPAQTRAEVVHALVQQLADLEATQRHQSPRAVPRLSTDLAIPDQLTVMARDLLVEPSDSQVLAEAAAAVEAIRQRVAE